MRRLLQPNLGSIQPELLRAFEGTALVRRYRKGTTVYRRGRGVRGIFLVQKGRVRLSVGDAATSLALSVAGPGCVLGLGETISGSPYEATVETLDACELAFLRRENFLTYLRQNCGVCLQLVHLLSEDLHRLYQQYRTIGGPATRVRKPRANGKAESRGQERPSAG